MTAGFMVASVYAVGWLRGRRDRYHRLGFTVPFTIGAVLAPIQWVIGDIATRAVFEGQPAKFAAMEATWKTQSHNPEWGGGVMRPDATVVLGAPIPSLHSLPPAFPPSTLLTVPPTSNPNAPPRLSSAP